MPASEGDEAKSVAKGDGGSLLPEWRKDSVQSLPLDVTASRNSANAPAASWHFTFIWLPFLAGSFDLDVVKFFYCVLAWPFDLVDPSSCDPVEWCHLRNDRACFQWYAFLDL
jgi:hypothetical protein